MTNDQFRELVARLEERSRRDPGGYKLRVVLLALAGYGYVGLALVLLLVLFVAVLASVVFLKAVAIKLAIPVGIVVFLVVKAMWVRLPAPVGRELRRDEAPALFEMIDGLRRKLAAPRFHRVLLTSDFNAAVAQVPLLGVLGWHRNYLLIGLPLMKSLTPGQLEAVLAHEFGHLAGGHGRLSNWIYRLRVAWLRLVGMLEEQKSWGTFMFRPFFNWYAPYFSAYSFPLARANEYEADAAAARLVSPQALGQALSALNVVGSYLDQRYWPRIHKQADDLPQPGFAPYSGLNGGLASDLEDKSVHDWLAQAMQQETTVDNTHPALADRLKAIGEQPGFAPPAAGQAADILLGEALAGITDELDRQWQAGILASWQQRHEAVRQERARLAELDAQVASQAELSLQDAYDRACLTESVGAGADAALEQFRALHGRAPDDAHVCMSLGQRLLARDDESGRALVERAMAQNEDLLVQGYETLRNYCWRMERKPEAHDWHERLTERLDLLDKAQHERADLHSNDKLERHDLSDEAVADLLRQLEGIEGVRKLYLVRKRVKHLTHRPLYILAHAVSPWWWHSKRRAAAVQEAILARLRFPGEALVVNVEGGNYWLGRKLRFMRGSRIS